MDNYIELEGTKEQIINQLIEQPPNIDSANIVTKRDIGYFLDLVEQNRDLLSDDEIFEKRIPDYDGNSKFITPNAEYYISIKKITLAIIAEFTASISMPISLILRILGVETEGAYVKKLDSILGESCIMLEAARKKREGINKNLFKSNRGECVNVYLHCKYNIDDKCTCTSKDVENICESLEERKILLKKRNRYFYSDIF